MRSFTPRLRANPILNLATVIVAAFALCMPVAASESWGDLRDDLFADRQLNDGGAVMSIEAPYRPEDQTAVPVSVVAGFSDGRTIKSVTFIVDENPVPVAAKFEIGGARSHLKLGMNLRFNRGSDFRTVIEASDGQLYMASRFVKFAGGQAACSAPPNGSPEEIMANMGKMTLQHAARATAATEIRPTAEFVLSHPNHSGMVLDQRTLLYIPLRIVSEVKVQQGDELVMKMSGSIAVSQDPKISFDYRVNGAQTLDIAVNDSDGTSWQRTFPINRGS